MLERGRLFSYAGIMNAATNEVFTTSVVSRMMHRVLVDNWEVEQAVAAAHKQVAEIYARHQEES
jgi:hypothetical protein